MGLFRKKADPISERTRALNSRIAELESKIRKLDTELHTAPGQPRLRSTTSPAGTRVAPVGPAEPVFEPSPYAREARTPEPDVPSAHFNELGVRKYDVTLIWSRVRSWFHGPTAHNPKLVSYLAAGSIKGLRPLRYEKRVARNRFIALLITLILLTWGIAAAFLRH
jgi:hypothetical protein